MKVVFLGTAQFAIPFLQALINNDFKPALVITQPDEPVGRRQELQPLPVKAFALQHNLSVSQPKNKVELAKILQNQWPDICVLVAYGLIIPRQILAIPSFGFVNVHPSLLPRYRGPSPVQSAILKGNKITGVTIMLLDEKMDHGPILTQQELEVSPTDNNETLHQKLAEIGAKLLIETLPKYLAGEIKPQPQDNAKATYTKIIKRQDGQINWSKSAQQIEAQFRAFYPWPGVFSHWGKKRLKIANLSVLEGDFGPELVAGQVFLSQNKALAVKCSQGAIVFKRVQLEGKKEMFAKEFLRGNQEIVGAVLRSD